MKHTLIKYLGGMIFAGLLGVSPAFADTGHTALPGTVNYVEGNVDLGNQTLNSKSVGSATLEPGQSLLTNQGKAEMLLTPGVFVRLDDNSVVQLVSGDLTKTEVRVDRGAAMLEVDELHKDNNLMVADNGATTHIEKTGLYEFDADHAQVLVYKGEAQVEEGDQHAKVKGGHELTLTAAKLKTQKFDKDKYEASDLYKFSSLRSQYIGEASADEAQVYVGGGWAPGWFWDPWFSAYTFFPGGGFLYSPFGYGWGFFSPTYIGYYGMPYGGYGWYGHGYTHGRPYGHVAAGHVRAAAPAHSFGGHAFARSGVGGFHGGFGGSFHGAGGGFHH